MRQPFNPSEYSTYSDLPEPQKTEFRQIDENGSFVNRQAEHDPDKAHEEANDVTLTETGDITYRQGSKNRGSEYDMDITINGDKKTVWLKNEIRQAMETKLLTAAVREAIEQTRPKYIEVIGNNNDDGRPLYRISSADMENWAQRAALKLREINGAKKTNGEERKGQALICIQYR